MMLTDRVSRRTLKRLVPGNDCCVMSLVLRSPAQVVFVGRRSTAFVPTSPDDVRLSGLAGKACRSQRRPPSRAGQLAAAVACSYQLTVLTSRQATPSVRRCLRLSTTVSHLSSRVAAGNLDECGKLKVVGDKAKSWGEVLGDLSCQGKYISSLQLILWLYCLLPNILGIISWQKKTDA